MKINFFLKIFLTFVLLSIFTIIVYILFFRSPIYKYKPNLSYEYNFDNSEANKYILHLDGNKLNLPKIKGDVTAFLKVEVTTNFFSKLFKSSIRLVSEDLSVINDFEKGAKNTRYINISKLINSNSGEIDFFYNNIAIIDPTVELIIFKNSTIQNKRTLIIAPHPDDAEIAAYGLYAKNSNSFVVTITAGEAGDFTYDEVYKDTIKHYLKKGQLRTLNSITVPLLGGIPYQNIVNLGFFDTTLEAMYKNDTLAVKSKYCKSDDINTFRKQNISNLKNGLKGIANWNSLIDNLCYLLDTIKPEIIVSPYPLLDTHNDHKFSTIALIEALKKSNIKDGQLLLYTNHYPLSDLYPYGETGHAITLPPNFNKNLYFKSIYSNPLSNELQQDKIFALEDMNDLRLDTEWRSPKGAIKIALKTIKRKYLGPQIDYFRKSVRSNELFFVMPISDIYDKEKLKIITDYIVSK
ncbi:PIG-L deacetylase family protein [Aureibaculum luteum]|uniref:PIG-L deacetylase family protein n=1 Tax=Aureibaculum luteum TaxID=1548456 RepID=UPI000E4805E1|nr:PIG-L family deacetylase [Aureibaculum luteum]